MTSASRTRRFVHQTVEADQWRPGIGDLRTVVEQFDYRAASAHRKVLVDERVRCELAQSNKTPDESIGNKGVGFKSVLQVCEWPEIYSRSHTESAGFDGYCFTFARPDAYDGLARGDTELDHMDGRSDRPVVM